MSTKRRFEGPLLAKVGGAGAPPAPPEMAPLAIIQATVKTKNVQCLSGPRKHLSISWKTMLIFFLVFVNFFPNNFQILPKVELFYPISLAIFLMKKSPLLMKLSQFTKVVLQDQELYERFIGTL